ncbi:MAG: hypothetical protein K2X67_10350 [Burkholderiales bacterium]|nr:hypothetical protein [Burkholderiales bacterium]
MYQGSVIEVHCPRCNAVAFRVRRRWVDKFTSLFRPVRRFRCQEFRCGWEGNVPLSELHAQGVGRSVPPAA